MRSDERPTSSVPGMVPAGRTKNATVHAAATVVQPACRCAAVGMDGLGRVQMASGRVRRRRLVCRSLKVIGLAVRGRSLIRARSGVDAWPGREDPKNRRTDFQDRV